MAAELPRQGEVSSRLLVEQAFDGESADFVDRLCALAEPPFLAGFARRWAADPRPWARARLLEYLDRPLAHRGHEVLVKRLFKHFEAAGDDEVLGAFAAAFDRATRRVRRRTWSFAGGVVTDGERLATPLDSLPHADATARDIDPRVKAALRQGPVRRRMRRLFTQATRHHLRRRAWRWFRRAGRERPADYVRIAAPMLARHRDEDVALGENLLDCWTLVHALFGRSDVLAIGKRHVNVRDGASFAALAPAPRFPELWRAPEAGPHLFALVETARSRLVRRWAMDVVLRDHRDAALALGAGRIVALISHDDEEVQTFAADLLGASSGIERLAIDTWVAAMERCGPAARETVCRLFEAHMDPARLTLPLVVGLVCARPAPVALLGLRLLRTRTDAARDPDTVARLAGAACAAAGHEAAVLGLVVVGADAAYDRDRVVRFFDAHERTVRDGAWAWLETSPRAWSDAALWARLAESPYDETKSRVIAALSDRERRPAMEPDALAPLWTAVLLGVHRGGAARSRSVRQVVEAVVRRPADADRLLPVLALPARSIRAPDRRAGLAALAEIVARRPELAEAVARHCGEVTVGAGGIAP